MYTELLLEVVKAVNHHVHVALIDLLEHLPGRVKIDTLGPGDNAIPLLDQRFDFIVILFLMLFVELVE